MIFLSSLPRSGTTLLTSLLNQRDDVYATPTSNLTYILEETVSKWNSRKETQAQSGTNEDLHRLLKGIVDSRYTTDKLIFDNGRDWADPKFIKTMQQVVGDVKIVATVRPVAECVASFVKIAKPTNINNFLSSSKLIEHLMISYQLLKTGYEKYPDCFLLIEYKNLVTQTQKELDRISKFVGLEKFKHDLNNVPESKEVDNAWNIKDLHKVRKKVSRNNYSAKKILGNKLYDFYQGGEFWNDKPEPKKIGLSTTKQKEQIMLSPKSFNSSRPFGPIFSSIESPDEITDALIKMTDNLIEDKNTQSMGAGLAGVIDKELQINKKDMYEAGCDNFFESCVLNYIHECARLKEFDLTNCKITNNINACWLVSQYENEYNPVHNHGISDISGVLYLKVPDYKNRRNIESKSLRYDNDGDINFVYSSAAKNPFDFAETGMLQISAKAGLLLLFPSNLLHTVYPFIGEGERRSISFNAVYNVVDPINNIIIGNHIKPKNNSYTDSKE